MTIVIVRSQAEVDATPGPKSVCWTLAGWEVRTGADVPPPVVPQEVTLRQFKQGLTRLSIRSPVEAWISTQSQDVKDWYTDSNAVQRQNPILLAAASHFGLSADQVDAAFVMMSGL